MGKTKITTFPHPIDSGWSWMVLLATFMIFLTFGGILRSFGIYMVEFISEYNTDSTSSALLIGVQFAASGLGSVLGINLGMQFFSPRQLMIGGGLLGSFGLIINMFAKSIYFFLFSHSILLGIALGLLNGTCLYSLGEYFDKHRSLANGVTMSAVSLGGLIMGPLSRYLIDTYGLNGAFLIIGGIHLHAVIGGCLIRPKTFYQVVRKIQRKTGRVNNDRGQFSGSVVNNQGHRTRASSEPPNSDIKLPNEQRTRKISDPRHLDTKSLLQQKNRHNTDSSGSETSLSSEKRTRKISDQRKPEYQSLLDDRNEQMDGFRPRSNTGDSFSPLARKAMLQRMRSRTESEVAHEGLHDGIHSDNTINSKHKSPIPINKRYLSNEFLYDESMIKLFKTLSEGNLNRENASLNSSISFVKTESLKRYIQIFCDCSLFRNFEFTIFLISYLFGSVGCFYPVVFIPPLADSYGISKIQQSLLISILSAVDIFGRAGSGFFADRGFISRKQLMILAYVICGVSNCLNSLYIEFWSLSLFSVIYGFVGGTTFAINSSTLSEIVDGEKFVQAIGWMIGLQQLILGVSGPLTGALRDITGSYGATFYFLGATNLIAAFLLSIELLLSRMKRAKKTATEISLEVINIS